MSTFKRIDMTPTNKVRSQKLKAEVQKEMAAKGDIHFRIDPQTYLTLADLATRNHMGIGVLARFWVMERLQQELNPTAHNTALAELTALLDKCLGELQQVNRRLEALEGGKEELKPKSLRRYADKSR